MGLLKFGLLCTNFLAWPVIALLYPLFASIRAIETGSKYHMKKLIIYWTIFSLISLFEYAFVKIIEWVPFWSSIKLAAIYWLAIPRFHGACYAYENFIHPCLVVKIQEAIRRFEEQSRTKETFLDEVAHKYAKENGLYALENLIATKRGHKESDDSQKDTAVLESDEKNAGATLKLLKGPDAAQSNEMLEVAEKRDDAIQADAQRPVSTASTNETTYAAALTKGLTILPTQTLLIPGNRNTPPPSLINKDEPREWTCTLCQVTVSSGNSLNDHLRGKKHKAMCRSMKTIKLVNVQDHHSGATTAHYMCVLCDAKMVGQASLSSHLKGKRHMYKKVEMGKN